MTVSPPNHGRFLLYFSPASAGLFFWPGKCAREDIRMNALVHARSHQRASMILFWRTPRFALALRLLGAGQPGLCNLKQRSAVGLVCRGLRQSPTFLGVFPELGGALHAHPRI